MTSSTHRLTLAKIAQITEWLSVRDRNILSDLATLLFASGAQLQRLHFTNYASAVTAGRTSTKVLHRLAETGLVAHLDRRIGGARRGSDSYVWYLTAGGQRLLATLSEESSLRVYREPSLRTLRHSLAITETYARLRELARAGRIELVDFQAEPVCWRQCQAGYGASIILKPDAYAVTAAYGASDEDLWFIEVDCATESMTVLGRKADRYRDYYCTGEEQRLQGVFPRTIWLTPNQSRADLINQTVNESDSARGQPRLHTALTFDAFLRLVCQSESSSVNSQ